MKLHVYPTRRAALKAAYAAADSEPVSIVLKSRHGRPPYSILGPGRKVAFTSKTVQNVRPVEADEIVVHDGEAA